jgi:hypothetical protein
MSPLSTKDEGEIRLAAGGDSDLAAIDLSHSLLEVHSSNHLQALNPNACYLPVEQCATAHH